MMRPRLLVGLGAATAAVVVVSIVGATLATRALPTAAPAPSTSASAGTTSAVPDARSAARAFLADWSTDGRVIRRDQGGDTVSEGQAYGMLAAVAADDRGAFTRVWGWTREHLQRPDGLLAWRFDHGRIVDDEPASDADLDAARALVLAGSRFSRDDWTREGVALGDRILDRLTVVTERGRILLPGLWAASAPYTYNPSYASPVAFAELGAASHDPRWTELADGSAAVTAALLGATALPPDWAQVDPSGAVRPMPPPQGGAVVYGYDAARVALRYAESCRASDRALAARMSPTLSRESRPAAQLDLGGGPAASGSSPLMLASRAAADAAADRTTAARSGLAAAARLSQRYPTYYGAAWTMLADSLLSPSAHPALGGCGTGKDS